MKNLVKTYVGVLIALFSVSPVMSFGIEFSGMQCTTSANVPCDSIFFALISESLIHYAEQANDQIPVDEHSLTDFLSNTSVSFGMAQKGLTTDYGSNIRVFMIGAGFGIGGSAGDVGFQNLASGVELPAPSNNYTLPGIGAGFGGSAMLGVPLKRFNLPKFVIDPNRMKLFLGFMYLPYTYAPDNQSTIDLTYLSYSAHAQYKIIKKRDLGFSGLRWGGLDLTSGLEYNSMSMAYSTSRPIEPSGLTTVTNASKTQSMEVLSLGNMGNLANVTVTGDPSFNVQLASMSVPIELSTSVRLLYLVTFFGGGAVDINIGRSAVIAEPTLQFSGDLLAGDPFNPTSTSTITSNAKLDMSSEGSPEIMNLRIFAGVQLNLAIFKLVINGSYSPSPQSVGANFAIRTGI